MEIASFEKFLTDKIKVGNKTGERADYWGGCCLHKSVCDCSKMVLRQGRNAVHAACCLALARGAAGSRRGSSWGVREAGSAAARQGGGVGQQPVDTPFDGSRCGSALAEKPELSVWSSWMGLAGSTASSETAGGMAAQRTRQDHVAELEQ